MPRNNAKPLPPPEILFVKPAIYPKTEKHYVIRDPKTMRKIPAYGARVEDCIDIQRHLLDKTLLPAKQNDVEAGTKAAREQAKTDAVKAEGEAKKTAAAEKKAAEEMAKAEAEAAEKKAAAAKKSTTPGNS